jgi:hypothetical protein
MPQTRMFRDRVVSMEQTLEGGEKNLELLKAVCREALPEFTYREHSLDHERDLFVMVLEAPDGRTKKVSWTRMVLFDAERIPVLTGDPLASLRTKIVEFLRSRASRPEIVVTFRHLEEGWIETPEPRRERRRRRGRRDRGRREAGRGAPVAVPRPSKPAAQPPPERRPGPAPAPAAATGAAEGGAGKPAGGRRRRRFRRRRRGRGWGGGSPAPGGSQQAP